MPQPFLSILRPSSGDWQTRLVSQPRIQHIQIESAGHSSTLIWISQNLRSGAEVFRERCERGYLHPNQQAITQQGRGQYNLPREFDPILEVSKRSLILSGLYIQTMVEGSTEILMYSMSQNKVE